MRYLSLRSSIDRLCLVLTRLLHWVCSTKWQLQVGTQMTVEPSACTLAISVHFQPEKNGNPKVLNLTRLNWFERADTTRPITPFPRMQPRSLPCAHLINRTGSRTYRHWLKEKWPLACISRYARVSRQENRLMQSISISRRPRRIENEQRWGRREVRSTESVKRKAFK